MQARSENAVAATLSYSLARQTVSAVHVRSLVSVSRLEAYCVLVHTVACAQTRSDVAVAAAVWY